MVSRSPHKFEKAMILYIIFADKGDIYSGGRREFGEKGVGPLLE